VKQNGQNYTLLTSQTKDSIKCPDNDVVAKRISDDEVELTFLKNIKITKE